MKNYIFKIIALILVFLSANLYGMHEDLGFKIQRIIDYIQNAEKQTPSGRVIVESLKERNRRIRENLHELTSLIENALIEKLEGGLPNVSTEQLKEWKGIKDYLQRRIVIEERQLERQEREKSPEYLKQQEIERAQRQIEKSEKLIREKQEQEEKKKKYLASAIKIPGKIALDEEAIKRWIEAEKGPSSMAVNQLTSIPELFDYIIAGKQQGYLQDVKKSEFDGLIDNLNNAIIQEESMNRFRKKRGLNIDKFLDTVVRAKNQLQEFQDAMESF